MSFGAPAQSATVSGTPTLELDPPTGDAAYDAGRLLSRMFMAIEYGIPSKLDRIGQCHFAKGTVRPEVSDEVNRILQQQSKNLVFCDRYDVLALCTMHSSPPSTAKLS